MALSDVSLKNFQATSKDIWLSDEKGLRVLVKAKTGAKYFRMKYRFNGKQKTLALGTYPETSLKQARIACDEARQLLREGKDPAQIRKNAREQISTNDELREFALEWWNHQKGTWTKGHAERVWTRLEDNAFKFIGSKDLKEVRATDVIQVVRKIESRDALDVAQRVLQDIRRIFRFAVQTGRIELSPVSDVTAEVLKSRKVTHRASLKREDLPEFLHLLDNYHCQGRLLTKLAIQMLVYTFVRQGELRGAKWSEFDLENGLWRIPGERMKMGTDHIVPLAPQVLVLLEKIREISGNYELLFPSERDRFEPMSDNTMRRAIFKLGYDGETEGKRKCTPNGFRSTACSILNESGFNPDAIERQMSHVERNGVRAAYIHHARFLKERREMMAWWADHLDALKNREYRTTDCQLLKPQNTPGSAIAVQPN